MTPNYDRAAIAAMQTLIDNQITETPISALPMLKRIPNVRVMTFARFANEAGQDRETLVPIFAANQDAATFRLNMDLDGIDYVVVYNLRLPYEIINRALAREMGHIVLNHDGVTRPYEVRRAEAMTFAHHLLSPRPILHMIQQSNIPLTMNVLSDTTGCIDECVLDMQEIPGTAVPASLNRQVKAQFERGISEYLRFRTTTIYKDRSPLVELGSYMDLYEE